MSSLGRKKMNSVGRKRMSKVVLKPRLIKSLLCSGFSQISVFISLILLVGGVLDTKQTLFRNLWPDEAHAYQSSAVQPFKGHSPRYRHHLRH